MANISVADVLLSAGATGEPFSKATTETLYPTSSGISIRTLYAREENQPGLVLSQEPWKVTLEIHVRIRRSRSQADTESDLTILLRRCY